MMLKTLIRLSMISILSGFLMLIVLLILWTYSISTFLGIAVSLFLGGIAMLLSLAILDPRKAKQFPPGGYTPPAGEGQVATGGVGESILNPKDLTPIKADLLKDS